MPTDALDRFGTRLEHRITRAQMRTMMEAAGLRDVRFPMRCRSGARSGTRFDGGSARR
jgi:hypothetical protein